tara:strand:- start:708 stop:1079 length:372 start_codon:yes stop_codon:yes gene_type:complete
MNVELTEEEYKHIIELRKSRYYLDITEDEYEMLRNRKEMSKKHTDKYVENIEKIKKEAANAYIAKSANDLLDRVNDLKLGKYDNGSFANSPGFLANYNQDTPERIQAEALNHMIRAIAAVYPN